MEQTGASDEVLMCRVVDGARDCLEPLVRRYANSLLTFIRHMVGDPHRSEELFQEVFVAVWQNRRRYDCSRRFKPWLYAIAVNKVREHLRWRVEPPVLSLEVSPFPPAAAQSASPVDTMVAVETAGTVLAGVSRLPLSQRTVVVLRVWSGLSYADIAAIVRRRETTVRANMHHALASLREYLEPRLR